MVLVRGIRSRVYGIVNLELCGRFPEPLMLSQLERLREMVGKWHIVERWLEVDGEHYKFTQDRDTMIVTDNMGAAFARLSVRLEGKTPPEGWFWLRNWSENEAFWEKVAEHFELGTERVQVSPYVDTVAARFLISPPEATNEKPLQKALSEEGRDEDIL